tara:strand:- start:506 stop:1204 length:699 start_codon:yes stop_codon:yes gene_type:complete
MSEVRLTADSGGGYVELKAPSTTASNAAKSLVLPNDIGSAGQYLKNSSTAGTLEFGGWTTVTKLVSSDLTGNNAFTTTGLDGSAIKRLTMVAWGLNNDGTSGNNSMMCRIGDGGGLESADYTSTRASIGSASNGQNDDTSEWTIGGGSGGSTDVDAFIFELMPVKTDGTSWVAQWRHHQHQSGTSGGGTWTGSGIGTKVLSSELDRISFYWANSKNYAHDVSDGLIQLHYIT